MGVVVVVVVVATLLGHSSSSSSSNILLFFAPQVAQAEHVPFLFISDIHLDMWYGTPEAAFAACRTAAANNVTGTPGCDSPKGLLKSLVDDVSVKHPNTRIIYAGDWLRHFMNLLPIDDAYSSMKYAAAQIAKIPHSGLLPAPTPFASPALGNNDFVPDYNFNVLNTSDRAIQSNITAALVENELLNEAESQTFAQCAYFTRLLPGLPLRVIVLNTLVYSVSLIPSIDPTIVTDPCDQFAFLQAQLENVSQMNAAADQGSTPVKAIVLSHIPPTQSLYGLLANHNKNLSQLANDNVFLHQEYQSRLQDIFQNYSSVISMHFYGHTHQFSLLADPALGAPGLIVPAITPVYDNKPAYLSAQFDTEAGTFSNFKLHHLTVVEQQPKDDDVTDATTTTTTTAAGRRGMRSSFRAIPRRRRSAAAAAAAAIPPATTTRSALDSVAQQQFIWATASTPIDTIVPVSEGVEAMRPYVLGLLSSSTAATANTSTSTNTTDTNDSTTTTGIGGGAAAAAPASPWQTFLFYWSGGFDNVTAANYLLPHISRPCDPFSECRIKFVCSMLGSSAASFRNCVEDVKNLQQETPENATNTTATTPHNTQNTPHNTTTTSTTTTTTSTTSRSISSSSSSSTTTTTTTTTTTATNKESLLSRFVSSPSSALKNHLPTGWIGPPTWLTTLLALLTGIMISLLLLVVVVVVVGGVALIRHNGGLTGFQRLRDSMTTAGSAGTGEVEAEDAEAEVGDHHATAAAAATTTTTTTTKTTVAPGEAPGEERELEHIDVRERQDVDQGVEVASVVE